MGSACTLNVIHSVRVFSKKLGKAIISSELRSMSFNSGRGEIGFWIMIIARVLLVIFSDGRVLSVDLNSKVIDLVSDMKYW